MGGRLRDAARSAPGAPALVTEDHTLTYGELCDQVGRLARLLSERGVAPGDRVALLLERSVDFVVGWLAAIWSGAVALPLDPTDPTSRNQHLARLCGARLVVTQSRHAGRLWADAPGVLELDTERFRLVTGEPLPPASGLGPESPAAICCTSGSTGVPKAVLVPHQAVLAGVDWVAGAFGAGAGDGHVLKTAVNFISVLRQVAWPLLTGGWTYVLPARDGQDLAALARVLRSHEVTICSFFPSTLNAALEAELPLGSSLRHLMVGGEPLPGDLVRRAATRTGAAVHNVYGMTECNVALWYPCAPDARFETAPLGDPVDGVTAVLDQDELLVSGRYVALEYVGQPDLTAERFSRTADGLRGFATRDLVSRGPDGLRFAGRADDNVKVRGYSVQLGGVEHTLSRHPAVRECAVLVRSRGVSDQRLEAFATVRRPVPAAELQEYLRGRLPGYMVPGVLRIVDGFPRRSNGKVDRQRLLTEAEAGPGAGAGDTAGAAPADGRAHPWPDEAWLDEARALFAGALDAPPERVEPDSDFFDLGGHSLLVLRLGTEIERRHGLQVEMDELLGHSTPGQLAGLLAQRAAEVGGG